MAIEIVERAITIERTIKKRSKDLIPKIKQIRSRAINVQGAIEKCLILLSQYWRKNKLIAPLF